MRSFIRKHNRWFNPLVLLPSLALMFCDPGTSLDPVVSAGGSSGSVAKLQVLSAPTEVLPTDTSLVQIFVADSIAGLPLGNARLTVSSDKFALLSADSSSSLRLDSVPMDGRVSFRIYSSVPGAGLVTVQVTSGDYQRSVALNVSVTQDPTLERSRNMVFTALRPTLRADGSDSTQLQVLVKDDDNNPMSGQKIKFTSTGGVVKAEATTDEWGKAYTVLISERANKSVVVTATLVKTGAKAQQRVAFDGVTISINPAKAVLMRDSVDPVVFELRDGADVPMSGDSLEITVLNAYQGLGQTGVDSLVAVTDTRGQYKSSITAREAKSVIITAKALGAKAVATVTFTTNSLNLSSSKISIKGDGTDQAVLTALLRDGNNNNINGAELRWTTTFGNFASSPFTTTSGGQSAITLRSAKGSGLAIVNVEAYRKNPDSTRTLLAGGNITLPVTGLKVSRLELKVSPDNIPVKVGEAALTAQAFDSAGNVMTGVLVAFRLVKGAGGGDEVIDPPVAYTKAGSASAIIKAGGVISQYRGVKLAATALDIADGDTLIIASSDTASLTISGPPAKLSVGVNIFKGHNKDDGTFGLPAAAVVTDVNGNLVADGTPVNFSTTPVGALYWGISWEPIDTWPYYTVGDTVWYLLPWTDYNNNRKLDTDESPSSYDLTRSRPARGEDRDGNGVINFPLETFTDLNGNGVWDSVNAEPLVQTPATDSLGLRVFVDFNRDGIQQQAEPYNDYNGNGRCQCAGTRDASGNLYESTYFGSPANRPFPGDVSAGITRSVSTSGGKSVNEIIYVQSQARYVMVRITAEANGISSFVETVLPIVESSGGGE